MPLSGGAVAGIVLGCLVFVAALLAVLFLLWRRRTRTTVRSLNSKPRSPVSPRSPWPILGRSETTKSQGGGKHDLDLASGVPELLSSSRNNGLANRESGGRNRFESVLANVRRLTPPRRPPNPQSSNLNFNLVESNVESNSTSTHTHTNTQSQSHAHTQLRHPYAYPLPQPTPTPTTGLAHVQYVHTRAQPASPTSRDKENRKSRTSSALHWMKSTVRRLTPTTPKGFNPPLTSAPPQPHQQRQQQLRPMIDLLSASPTSPHHVKPHTDNDRYAYIGDGNRVSARLRSPAVDPNRPPSPRVDGEPIPMGMSTAEQLAWMGGVAGTAPLREDVLHGAWVGEGGALFISRESLERRERERRRWRDDAPILLPSEDGSLDDEDEEERIVREVMERTRIEAEASRGARAGYVPALTRPQPQASGSGSGLYSSHVHPTTTAQQPRPRPQPQPLQQQQQQQSTSQSLVPVGPLSLPEIRFSPSPLLAAGMMPGSAFPSKTSLLNLPPPPLQPPRPTPIASTSGWVQPQLSQPLPPLPPVQQSKLYPTVIATTTDTRRQADLPELQIPIPPLEAASTGSPISPSLLAPSGLSPTSLEWISPPESFTEHPDVPVSVYSSGNGGGGRKSRRRSKGGMWQLTSPIDAPASSSMPFAVVAERETDSTTTGLKRTTTHPPRIPKPQGARAKEALPSSITKRMFSKAGVGLGPGGGGGGKASAMGKQPQLRSMSADSAGTGTGTGTGSGMVAGGSGSAHLLFVPPGPPPPLVVRPSSASNVRVTRRQPPFPATAQVPAPTPAANPVVQQQPSVSAPALIQTRHPLPPPPFGMPPRPVLSPIPGSPLPHSQLSPQAPQFPPGHDPRPRPTSPPVSSQDPPVRESRFSMLSLLQPPSRHSNTHSQPQPQPQSQSQSQSNISQVLSPPPQEEGRFAIRIGSPYSAQSSAYAMPFMGRESTDSIPSIGRSVRRLPPIPGRGRSPSPRGSTDIP